MGEDKVRGQGEVSFSEISAELGVTRQRVEQIYAEAMGKIRAYLRERPELAEHFESLISQSSELRNRRSLKIREEKIRDLTDW